MGNPQRLNVLVVDPEEVELNHPRSGELVARMDTDGALGEGGGCVA